jgi:hypothetical protein
MPQAEAYSTGAGRRLLRAIPHGLAKLEPGVYDSDRIYARAWIVLRPVRTAALEPGDLLLYSYSGKPQHLRAEITGGRWRHLHRDHFDDIRSALDAGHLSYILGTWDRDDLSPAYSAACSTKDLRGYIGRVLGQMRRVGKPIKAPSELVAIRPAWESASDPIEADSDTAAIEALLRSVMPPEGAA